jgi:hypothetical protein
VNTRGRILIRARTLAIAAGAGLFVLAAGSAGADDTSLLHRREHENRSIPANVEVQYGVVLGTVTVRSGGVLVNPQEISYAFQPDFPGSQGYLWRVGDGTYVLRAQRVPIEDSHTLIIRGTYNDTIVRDGIVQRLGETTSGSLRLQIPFGRDSFDFGEQLLDLQ